MPKAIRIHAPGGPDVLRWEEVEVGEPGAGEVRLRQEAAGLNFIDVYQREGIYKMPTPFGLGMECAGEVIAVGNGKVLDNGTKLSLDVKAGDKILFGKYSGTDIKIDGQEYLILREDEVLAVIG